MKEATGELNITVITILAIAAIAGLFYAFIWPAIESNINRATWCATAYNCSGEGSERKCTVVIKTKDDGTVETKQNFNCPEGQESNGTP